MAVVKVKSSAEMGNIYVMAQVEFSLKVLSRIGREDIALRSAIATGGSS